jgi:rSAM-associated Gly-rich repeat protein
MDEQPDRYQSVKSILLDLVKAGVGSAVLASSLLSTSGADAAPSSGADLARIEKRVREMRDRYGVQPNPAGDAGRTDRLLAWFNGGWRNVWFNGGWPNIGWRNLWLNGGWPNGGWGNVWRNFW